MWLGRPSGGDEARQVPTVGDAFCGAASDSAATESGQKETLPVHVL